MRSLTGVGSMMPSVFIYCSGRKIELRDLHFGNRHIRFLYTLRPGTILQLGSRESDDF